LHVLKFGTLFLPSSIKNISLYFRRSLDPNSLLARGNSNKILVKQSYMFMIWIHYIMSPSENTDKNATCKRPCFFIYPFRNYKTTIVKAPMAHRTYSQEQFMIRYYKLSISFKTSINTTPRGSSINSVNEALYFCLRTKMMLPCVGTNMLFLHKYSFNFYSKDTLFFSFFTFSNDQGVNRI